MAIIEISGKHPHLIRPSQALVQEADFFTKRKQNAGEGAVWKTQVMIPQSAEPVLLEPGNTIELPEGADIQIESTQYGSAMTTIVVNGEGQPQYDKITVHEAPSINIIAWYQDPNTAQIYIGMLDQKRPHAEQPEERILSEEFLNQPVVFRQIPMGFRDIQVNPDTGEEKLETIQEAAERELGEELVHGQVIKNIVVPHISMNYVNPTFVQDGANMVFIEIDPVKLAQAKMQTDTQEGILKAQFIPLDQALTEIGDGEIANGAIARSATSNATLLTYLAQFPAFIHALRNKEILNKQVIKNKAMKAADPDKYKQLKLQEFALSNPEKYKQYEESHPMRRVYQISTNPPQVELIK